jgi:cytochrome c oxidase subunit 2
MGTFLAAVAPAVNSFDPVTSRGLAISTLFVVALVISVAVVLLVFGLVAYVVVRFRGHPGDDDPPQVEGNRRLEIFYTATPALLLAVIFVFTISTMRTVAAPVSQGLRVDVVGHQWWWEFRYPDQGIVTANELHVPVGSPVQLALTGADVVHSFWVPQLGWKQDTVPGRTTFMAFTVDREGVYDGACAEFCGIQHAWMRVRLVAEPRAQFDTWAQVQRAPAAVPAPAATAPPGTPAPQSLVSRGQQIFAHNTCVNCHTIQGTGATGTVGPDLTHLASRATIGAGVQPNTPEHLREWIRNPQGVKPGVLMPGYSFAGGDLDALVAYLGSLR